jgi:hypothetical protein
VYIYHVNCGSDTKESYERSEGERLFNLCDALITIVLAEKSFFCPSCHFHPLQ